MRRPATAFRISALSFGLLISIAALAGCKKKTPAEKFGDKIENAGDEIEDEIDEAN